MKKGKIKTMATDLVVALKKNWNHPNPGEFLTIKEVTAFGLSQVGAFIYSAVIGLMVFGANYFCGAIMNIKVMDFTKITILGSIVGYVLMWMNPFGVLIYENHGKLEKRTKIFALISYAAQMVIGIACYFIPMGIFESVPYVGMIALPQILGNILTVGAFGNFCTWIVRYKFCAKYGRIKPFIILFGIPSAILMSIIPFLPIQASPYAIRLVVLHFAFSFMSYFLNAYGVVNNMVAFMTPNSQERQRMYSIVPIITSLAPSIIGMFFPMLIKLSGGYTSILTYKIFVPIFAFAGVAVSFFVIKCKERVIEKTDDSRPKVKFWVGAKRVLSNKYLWITNISSICSIWSVAYGGILQWWFIYSIRMEWFVGIAANIVVVSMTLGNLLTPLLTRKFEKKTILIWSKFVAIGTILLMFLSIKINSVILFMFAMFLRNGVAPIETGINSGMNADIMDYHQWRYGERADSMCGVFSWFLGPITMALSYVLPMLQQGAGFTSDWDILYNQSVIEKLFAIFILLSIVSTLISTLPFFFYDFTRAKHDKCIEDLQERLRVAQGEGAAESLETFGGGEGGQGEEWLGGNGQAAPQNGDAQGENALPQADGLNAQPMSEGVGQLGQLPQTGDDDSGGGLSQGDGMSQGDGGDPQSGGFDKKHKKWSFGKQKLDLKLSNDGGSIV